MKNNIKTKKHILSFFTLLVGLLCITSTPFNSFVLAQETSNQWFKQPTQENPTPKDSRLKEVLYRADKPRVLTRNRYFPEVSGREYIDCSYFKYVDCSNYTFCRCWQCRFHQYNFENVP